MKTDGFAISDLRVAYVIDPRFPGGTSSAVAAELDVVSRLARVEVQALDTAMFSGRRISPKIDEVVTRLNLPMTWDAREISADVVIFHNPSCLKFQDSLNTRIVARQLIVVTHENFLRPGGSLAFDVEKCLSQIAAHSIVMQRHLAPISAWNRETSEIWCRQNGFGSEWSFLEEDWFNICSFDKAAPTDAPKDRRGRHSRPGLEKFPSHEVMRLCFPETAVRNVILGADSLMLADDIPAYWALHRFGSLRLEDYFNQIDFFVYFTSATWRESFGRVIAEAIAAGKIVITDPETACTFNGAAIGAKPQEVDGVIDGYINDPDRYRSDVLCAQEKLERFSAEAFGVMFQKAIWCASGSVS
jgi:hypothetical protein